MPLQVFSISGTAGNLGTPGAPILHFALQVNAATGAVSGHATITQAVAPPAGEITIDDVTGIVRKLGFGSGPVSQVVSLSGTYDYTFPPPIILIERRTFTAHFATDSQWNGRGSFTYGPSSVDDVPVRSTKQPPIHTLYGVVIHDAGASGDLAQMRAVAAAAQQHLDATPAIQEALAALNKQIQAAGG